MKRYWFYGGMSIMMLLVMTACTPMQKDSAGKPIGDPTGRVINIELSCVGYCSGYAASGNEWCFCDAPCPENGNCCADFESACPELAR